LTIFLIQILAVSETLCDDNPDALIDTDELLEIDGDIVMVALVDFDEVTETLAVSEIDWDSDTEELTDFEGLSVGVLDSD
jgi:hypothetical protein